MTSGIRPLLKMLFMICPIYATARGGLVRMPGSFSSGALSHHIYDGEERQKVPAGPKP
jgi:hypothetical protein